MALWSLRSWRTRLYERFQYLLGWTIARSSAGVIHKLFRTNPNYFMRSLARVRYAKASVGSHVKLEYDAG